MVKNGGIGCGLFFRSCGESVIAQMRYTAASKDLRKHAIIWRILFSGSVCGKFPLRILTLPGSDIRQVMDMPDAHKLRFCMILFSSATENNQLFTDVLEKFFNGMPDLLTIELLEERRKH
jgi:uncharacterized protein (DUF1810 family)